MSVEKLVISKEASSFTVLPNKVLQNLCNADALGLWCYLASLPPDWEFYKEQIRAHFKIGRDKLDKLLSILKEYDLIDIAFVRDAQGRFVHWHIHVYSGNGFAQTEKPDSIRVSDHVHQNTEKPVSGEPPQWKTAPIKEIKNKTNKKHKDNISCASDEARSPFDDFWSIYPIKKNKVRAKGFWKIKKYDEIAPLIIADVKNRILNEAQWKEKKYIPHPSTYLQNARWTDEVTLEPIVQKKETGSERALRMCLN